MDVKLFLTVVAVYLLSFLSVDDEGTANITIIPPPPTQSPSENAENNNSFYSSTPMSKTSSVTSNGFSDALNVSNGSYILSPVDNDASPVNKNKENYMNNKNINGNTNGINNNINANTTTIIADIEGEVKKRVPRYDKIYYIAKEILTTEITYNKDLDVINTVSISKYYVVLYFECKSVFLSVLGKKFSGKVLKNAPCFLVWWHL